MEWAVCGWERAMELRGTGGNDAGEQIYLPLVMDLANHSNDRYNVKQDDGSRISSSPRTGVDESSGCLESSGWSYK